MVRHWSMMIGINQYQLLQPLMYAQFDAIELKEFLVNEAGLLPQSCTLLTDVAPMVYQGAAFPSREIILQRLTQIVAQAAPEDLIWVFFSGYGVHWEGQDYLLPIDADPGRIPQTGIAVENLCKILTGGKTNQLLVMLDMNRPQAALTAAQVGHETLEVAKRLSVPMVLSCQPREFSQETLAVRHGLFSEALLEALRFHGCFTLGQLVDYLTSRVPELCRHHWRPEQHPIAVIPPESKFLLLLPPSAIGQLPSGSSPGTDESGLPPPVEQPEFPSDGVIPPPLEPSPGGSGSSLDGGAVPEPIQPPLAPPLGIGISPGPELEPAPLPAIDTEPPIAAGGSTPSKALPLRWEWAWGGLFVAGLLLFGVLLRNPGVFWRSDSPELGSPPVANAPEGNTAASEADATATPELGAGQSLFPGTDIDPAAALDLARKALDEKQFGEALTWLNQIPEDQRPDDYGTLMAQAQAGQASAVVTGEAVLREARRMVEPVSASLFNDAIERARQVPLGDPDYDQAQADISRWSQVILDLAEGRAAADNFDGAIAAAQLVPEDQGEVYAQAQAQIQRWQQRKINRQLLQEAQGLLQPDQATSFESAIALVQQIPPDYPEYPIAQERLNQWSEDILVIARARAAAGQMPGAVAAANLVPPGTSAYNQAQEEIRRWQGL